MGKTSSRLWYQLVRPLKNWNIEERAHKAISKKARPTAPTFDSVKKQIEMVNKLEPSYRQIASKKHKELNENLKKVFVTSSEISEIDSRYNPDRPLPKDILVHESFEYGFYEPHIDKIPTGKLTLRQAVELITKHSKDPNNYTTEKAAEEYKLNPKVAADILEYFRVFNTFKEVPLDEQETIAMPLSLRSGLTVRFRVEKKKITPFEEVIDEVLKYEQDNRIDEGYEKWKASKRISDK